MKLLLRTTVIAVLAFLPFIEIKADILREYWLNILGANVSDLTNDPNFPASPSASNLLSTFEAPINWGDHYGTRVRGYITPPVSGNYLFWISSDDASQLWLSTDDNPANKTLIGSVPGWTNSREWAKYPSQKSVPIFLNAGQQYYVEALQKEHEGGDNLAVGWARPGDGTAAPSQVIPGSALAPWTGPRYNGVPFIRTPPDQSLAEAPVTLQLSATVRDDGLPLPANPPNPDPNDPNKLRWQWSVVATPLSSSGIVWSGNPNSGEAFDYQGSSNAPGTTFTCNPMATFDVPGTYLLNFRAGDGELSVTNQIKVTIKSTSVYRSLGYLYLSPLPNAEYTSPQTRFVLVRFTGILPTAVTNLSSFIHVTGASSGNHAGTTKIAGDNRTVIFTMTTDFTPNELVTVSLNPGVSGGGGSVQPYQYQFIISGHMPDPPIITARGDNPPNSSNKAFDGNATTKWRDLVVPNGAGNFSWIQYQYPNGETHVVKSYAVTSAPDAPERDPADWTFYGVDAGGNLYWLDAQTGQTFANRQQRAVYNFFNPVAYSAYLLQITRVNNPAAADSVQVGELEFIPASGSLLREYWLSIAGNAVSDLTSNPRYPASPSASTQISSFEAPTDWADNYGTRVRGYLTAPATGNFTFWIASDDNSQLWLSTDSNPANKAMIAYVPDWTSSRQWNKGATQKSAAIPLTAGQVCYVEALQKEGQGGDNLAVGWAKPGQSTAAPSEVIPGEVLSPWTGGPTLASTLTIASAKHGSAIVSPSRTGGPAVADSRTLASSAPASNTLSPTQQSAQGPLITSDAGRPTKLAQQLAARIMPNGVSIPSDFPNILVTTVTSNADPNPIFIDNRGGGGKPYNVIFDNAGSPIWYSREPDERRDMKAQANGVMTMLARDGPYHFNGLNTNYQQIKTYSAVNGYGVDEHELIVLADGRYFLIGLRTETVDMTRYIAGGNPSASVTEQIIQEFMPNGDLIFQWRSWDNFDIRDQQNFIDNTGSGFDFPHINSIDVDRDGHILISSRSTSECTKINADTGQIIWRLGGAHGDLTFINDALNGPRNQHAFRSIGTNRYTIFDNGNLHSPSASRAVEYVVNPTNKTATLVWQYPSSPNPNFFSFYMGNAQRLTNGNTLINWAIGGLPKITEVRPDGTKAYEMNWVNQWEAYRVWRCPWRGSALQPYLILESYPDNVTLIFNQFGDTNVAYYRIYGGPSPNPTTLLATSGTTLKRLSNLQNGLYYFRVTAVNFNGVEGQFSNEENVTVNIIKPGQNMVNNGDFSQGSNFWSFSMTGGATGAWKIESGVSHFDITNEGLALTSIQLIQTNKVIIQGNKYVLEFDAWSDQTRYIDVKVAQSVSPFTDYSHVTSPFLTPAHTHYRYVFTMAQATDFSANLIFNLGSSPADVYLDNIKLFTPPAGDLDLSGRVDYLDLGAFSTNWLRQQSGLPADLDGNNKVNFNDFGILGENWWTGGP